MLSVLALAAAAGAFAVGAAQSSGGASEPVPTPAPAQADAGPTVTSVLDLDSAELPERVTAQLEYVLANFQSKQSETYGYLPEYNCANFASQSLIVRGWQPSEDWYFASDVYQSSPSWRSSTALRDYLLGRPEVTELSDSERAEVQLGDLVQFDWDNSGDRDHTGIVSRIETLSDGSIRISFAGHTDDTDYRTVDFAITELHPGASVYYLAIRD